MYNVKENKKEINWEIRVTGLMGQSLGSITSTYFHSNPFSVWGRGYSSGHVLCVQKDPSLISSHLQLKRPQQIGLGKKGLC